MKKLRVWLLLVLVLSVCLSACQEIPDDYTPSSSNENPFDAETGYKKPEIELDGVLDEKQWEELKGFTFGDEISATVKAFYGETGLCIGAEVSDPELWAISSQVYDNSSFELYLDYSGKGGSQPEADQFQIFIDINEKSLTRRGNGGKWIEDSLIKNYAVKVNGTTGTVDPENGYCVELFIPYSQMGGEPQVDYGVAFGLVGCRENVRELWRGPSGVNVQSPETYLKLYRDSNSVEYFRKVNSSNLTLDGIADEEAWQNKPYYAFGDGTRGSVTSYMDEKGCYFFLKMRDDAVCAEGNSVFMNDSVEIYLDALSDGGQLPQTDDIQVRVDVSGGIEVLRGLGVGEWNNVMNNVFAGVQKGAEGYQIEVFVPWADLNYEFAPESLRVSFGSVDWDGVQDDQGKRSITWSGIGKDPQVPDTYLQMDKNGIAGAQTPAPPSEIVLDGMLTDSQWKGTPSFAYHNDQVNVNWFWTSQGCYMAFTVADAAVQTDGAKPFENSSIEVYLDYNYNGGKPDSTDRTVLVDAAGNILCRQGTGGIYQDFTTGRIQAGACKTTTGYVVELYLPWMEFGGGRPNAMGVAFGHVTRSAGQKNTAWHDDGYCPDPQNPELYSEFTPYTIGEVVGPPVEQPEINLDGIFDDSQWTDTPAYSYHADKVTVNWFWTDKGCYLAFAVEDGNVVTAGKKPFENSSVEIYMDYDADGGKPDDRDRTVLVDAAGNMLFRKGKAGVYKDFRTGNILSGVQKTETGYTVELFIPWAEFGGGRPETLIGIAFGQVTVKADLSGTEWHNDGLCPDPQDPDWYSSFSAAAIG